MKLKKLSESSLVNDLKDPDFAVGFLEEALKQSSMESFLLAVRMVARANGGLTKVSKKTELGRESMYKALSKSGNPQFSTLQSILGEFGLRFSVSKIA